MVFTKYYKQYKNYGLVLLFLITVPHVYFSNTENCKNTAKICKYATKSYRVQSNYIPYRINWYEENILTKSAHHRHRDSWLTVAKIKGTVSDQYYDTFFVLQPLIPYFNIYDSSVYYYNRLQFPNGVSVKKRQLYKDSLNTNIALIDRYHPATANIVGAMLAEVYKKDDDIYFISYDRNLEQLAVHKFRDTARSYTAIDSLIYYSGIVTNQYYYYGGVIDFKTRQVYTLKINTNWNEKTRTGDSTVYIDKINLNTGSSSPFFSFKSQVFPWFRADNSINFTHRLNRLFLFNDKLYIRNSYMQLTEYNLLTNMVRTIPLQFNILPYRNYGMYFNELYVDPYGFAYYFNDSKLQQHNLSNNHTETAVKESIGCYSSSNLCLANRLDVDCSGNFYVVDHVNSEFVRSSTEIDDSFTSTSKNIKAVAYFWNGDSIVLNYIDAQIQTTIDTMACRSFKYKNQEYVATGIYYDTMNNSCYDSIVALKVRINPSYNDTIIHTSCDSFIYKNTTYKKSGHYTFSNKTIYGCDSLQTLVLTILNYRDTFKQSSCDSFQYKNTKYKKSGIYTFPYKSIDNCDSFHYLDLTINPSRTTMLNHISCSPYKWLDSSYAATGLYTRQFKTINQCDSIVILRLKIGLNDKINLINGINYTALQDSVRYEWYRCNPWRRITNETKRTFTTKTRGSYAVVLDNGKGCRDTSDCIELYSSALINPAQAGVSMWSVFPNPFSDELIIDLGKDYKEVSVKIYDLTGRLISNQVVKNHSTLKINNSKLPSGVYYLQIETESQNQFFNIRKE